MKKSDELINLGTKYIVFFVDAKTQKLYIEGATKENDYFILLPELDVAPEDDFLHALEAKCSELGFTLERTQNLLEPKNISEFSYIDNALGTVYTEQSILALVNTKNQTNFFALDYIFDNFEIDEDYLPSLEALVAKYLSEP